MPWITVSALTSRQPLLLLLAGGGPAVFEADGAVEDGGARLGVDCVGAEVADALELDEGAGGERGEARLELGAPQHRERVGVEVGAVVDRLVGEWVLHAEEAVVES